MERLSGESLVRALFLEHSAPPTPKDLPFYRRVARS